MSGHSSQARPSFPRRGICGLADGPTCAVHCRRTRHGRRPLHAAPLCCTGGEGAPAIAERTRSALAARKAQGAKLGNQRNASDAAALGRKAQTENAALFATNTLPIIEAIRQSGVTDLRGIKLKQRMPPRLQRTRFRSLKQSEKAESQICAASPPHSTRAAFAPPAAGTGMCQTSRTSSIGAKGSLR